MKEGSSSSLNVSISFLQRASFNLCTLADELSPYCFIISDDENFKSVGKVKNQLDEDELGAYVQEMEVRPECETRYIKMVAKSLGVCPDWHVGAGDKAWLFCDEIIIE